MVAFEFRRMLKACCHLSWMLLALGANSKSPSLEPVWPSHLSMVNVISPTAA